MGNIHAAADPNDLARLFVDYANKKDLGGLVGLYEAEAVLAVGGKRIAQGHDEIRDFYSMLLEAGPRYEMGKQKAPLRMGDLALTSHILPDGSVTAEVARMQPDGSWLWIIDQPLLARTTAPVLD